MLLSQLQPSVSVAFWSDVATSKLWNVVSDPRSQPAFSNELQAVRLLDDGPIGLGSRFEGDQRRGEREWTTVATVSAFEPERVFAWTVPSQGEAAAPVSTWTISLTPVDGGTRLAQSVVLHGGPSPMTTQVTEHPETLFDVVDERLRLLAGNMMKSLRGLESLAVNL